MNRGMVTVETVMKFQTALRITAQVSDPYERMLFTAGGIHPVILKSIIRTENFQQGCIIAVTRSLVVDRL